MGAPGEPGDPGRIEHLARRLINLYGSLMDWAAEMRNTSVPDTFIEVRDAIACYADGPQLRFATLLTRMPTRLRGSRNSPPKRQRLNQSGSNSASRSRLTMPCKNAPSMQ